MLFSYLVAYCEWRWEECGAEKGVDLWAGAHYLSATL